jgi:hypothetical protein
MPPLLFWTWSIIGMRVDVFSLPIAPLARLIAWNALLQLLCSSGVFMGFSRPHPGVIIDKFSGRKCDDIN